MQEQFTYEVLLKLKKQKRQKIWKRILSVMMCLVVFCTTYMLILPAITQETPTFCGIEEHTHSEECYQDVLLCQFHDHTDSCYAPPELICTLSTDPLHTHEPVCIAAEETVLICGLEETEGHSHTEECAPVTTRELICTEAEAAPHTHADTCYEAQSQLICQEDHTHEDGCYSSVSVLICTLEETAGHTHADTCYSDITTYGCGLEAVEAHTHAETCSETRITYGCGQEEIPPHVHEEACYGEPALICTQQIDPTHVHTEECYGQELICQTEEHTHGLACYADPSADLESAGTWEATLPELSGNKAQDVIAIAESQMGYAESSRNYIVDENGNTKGYTRYGAWYGVPHGDWCAMFTSFCIRYAGMEDYPIHAHCPTWINVLTEQDLFRVPSEYIPKTGDLIFFDWERDGSADHVGFVAEVVDTDVITIEGNSGNRVAKNKYELLDNTIVGYGMIQVPEPPVEEPVAETINPGDTDAWADLIVPAEQIAEEPAQQEQQEQETASMFTRSAPAASTFSLRRTGASTFAARASTLDLTPYINDVTMYDEKGNPIPNGSLVTEGDLIEFKIDYTITGQQLGVMNGETVTVISNTLTYDLPNIFEIIQSDSGNIYNSVGQVVGTFTIDSETGSITLNFTESYVEQNAKGIQIQGHVSFFSTVLKITDNEHEDQDYKFTDNITLGVVIEEKIEAEGDLNIEKSKVSVDGEDIVYELTVTTAEGTNGPITITDQMSQGLTFKESMGIWKGNNRVNNASFNVAGDKRSFSLTLPEMAAGETYRVRYKCSADIDLLGADMTVRNTATVTGKDSQDNELKDKVTVDHTFDVLEKTGTLNDDGSISWTITVNQAKLDISGWTLKDIIRLQNQQVPYTGPVTIRGSRGNIVANNVTLPYTFPNGSTDTYTITYTTTHDFGDGATIYNSAILSDDDTDVNELTGVVVGAPFTKTGEAGQVIQDENGNYLLPITWTVTIDTRNGAIPGGVVFTDKFQGYPTDDMYITYPQMMEALANFEAEVMRVSGEDFAWFTAWVYAPGPESSDIAYDIDELWANTDNCQSMVFDRFGFLLQDKGIPKGHVLTFSYETYGIFPNNIPSTTTFKNQFSLMDQYGVESRVDYSEGTLKATKYGIKYYDPVAHKDQFWFWGNIDWSGESSPTQLNYNQLRDGYLAWTIELSAPPVKSNQDTVTMYEDLPEGVSVKDVRLAFQNNVPISQLSLKNLLEDAEPGDDVEPGEYKWEFPLYTAQQYVNWDHRNGTPVSIDVTVTEAGDLEITIPGDILEVMSEYAAIQNIEESYGYLTIITQINDDFAWTPTAEGSQVYLNTFENRFTLKTDKDVVIDIGSQSQQVRKDESEGAVRKQATTDASNIINYSVILNTYSKDLIENSEVLAVHDELTYTSTVDQPLRLRLVPGSVKLYEIRVTSDGRYEKLREVTANYQYEEASSMQDGTTTWVHTIDLNVPDDKSLLLEYAYKANGIEHVQHDVLNACTISGVGAGSIEGDSQIEIEVKDATAQADTKGVMIYKVDANSDGLFLENAKFNIYIWNKEQNDYIIVHHPENGGTEFITDASGMIVLDGSTMDQFAYNTAYYIVEVESPNGYYVSPEPYYFYIVNDNTQAYPSCIPKDFNGHALTSGDIIYRENVSATTEISIEKYWKDYGGDFTTVTKDKVSSITVELWRMLQGNPDSAESYGTYTITPDDNGNWRFTITDLPKATKNQNGTRGINYLYYVKEVKVNGYTLESAENNSGINSGTIKLVNREVEGYVLPETGGTGTQMYTTAGLLLMLTSAAYLMYIHLKRRREETNSP